MRLAAYSAPTSDFLFSDRETYREAQVFSVVTKNGCSSWHASPPFLFLFFLTIHAEMKPAQTTTVGLVMRVRGIKNKDINPVCFSLSLSREVRLRVARLPLRPLCLSWDALWLFVESVPSRAASAHCVCVCVRAAALIYKCLLIRRALTPQLLSFHTPSY